MTRGKRLTLAAGLVVAAPLVVLMGAALGALFVGQTVVSLLRR